jgi:lipopolysaccharide transport system ATP-binding protein
MSDIVIRVENLSKKYTLGTIGTGTLYKDLNLWWYKTLGKKNPYAKIDETGDFQSESEHWALRDVSFEIKQGDAVGVIGKNGAGKSTLLKILSRITTPTSGNIKIKGRVASLLEVGTGFHGELTGRENIYLNGAILGMSKNYINSKMEEIIEFSGVSKYIDTPVKRYSSGMYVRLAFAVAAHLEPEILVVDEVLAVGDAEFQKKCLGKMNDVSKNEGRTVLFVSHNMASVQNLCRSGIVLNKGQLFYSGTAKDSIAQYLQMREDSVGLSILERNDRQGGKAFRFSDIQITDLSNNILTSVQCGDDFIIEIGYKIFNEDFDFSDCNLSINVTDIYGTGLINSTTEQQGIFINNKEFHQKNKLSLTIKSLPLAPSSYSINLSFYKGYTPVDVIEKVYNLEIIAAITKGYKTLPDSRHGMILVESNWNI